jgi:hypothetical protein
VPGRFARALAAPRPFALRCGRSSLSRPYAGAKDPLDLLIRYADRASPQNLSLPLERPVFTTFHYNFPGFQSFSPAPYGVKLKTGIVSIRRSTKGIQPQDGRTGFGAPHVKPPVRPSLFLSTPNVLRFCRTDDFFLDSRCKLRGNGGRATKVYRLAPLSGGGFWPYLQADLRAGNKSRTIKARSHC